MNTDIIPMTRHAEKRSAERCIPKVAQWLLTAYGQTEKAGGGAVRYSFDKRAWREVETFFGPWPLKKMDQLRKAYMVVSDTGSLITIGYRQ